MACRDVCICDLPLSGRSREGPVFDGETRQSHFLRACVVKVAGSVCVRESRARERNAGEQLVISRSRAARNCIKAGDKYF